MKSVSSIVAASLVLLGGTFVAGGSERPAGASSLITTGCQWQVVPTPPEELAVLLGVSGTAPDDVWAVGEHQYLPAEPIILHWDGTSWTTVPFQVIQGRYLFGVAAISRADAWAVGASVTEYGTHSLAMHWDGTRWRAVRTPIHSPRDELNAVSAVSSADVWAAGYSTDDSGDIRPLTIHWDGTRWRIIPLSDPSTFADVFEGVAAVTADDVWAVGYQSGLSTPTQPLIEHWDGSGWTLSPQPQFPDDELLTDVSAASSDDVWAVGSLIEHWDGETWRLVPAPAPGGRAVSAIASTDAWIAGNGWFQGHPRVYTMRWNGSAWSLVSTPSPGDSVLYGIDAISSTHVWAVGASDSGPLAMVWDGCDSPPLS